MAVWRPALFLLLLLLASSSPTEGGVGPESDRVWDLPGQPPVGFAHYAGYVRVRAGEEKALFYWFFEAEGGAAGKPLVLWLNGGPGCSSVAYGAAQELGPFLVQSKGPNLTLNSHSWNKVANLLFLEAPVGVGFSYTNKSSDLHKLGDNITAHDSYDFLLNWFAKFPALKSHDFYLSGESYAGHYVPQLAELIYDRNRNASRDSYINIKGIMMGNAVLNEDTDTMGMVDYAWSHAIISDQLYHTIRNSCTFFQDDADRRRSKKPTDDAAACSPAFRAFLEAFSDIDIYSIYTPVCLIDSPRKLMINHEELWHGIGRGGMASGYDACTAGYVEKYFNREDVQKALHANLTHLSYPYTACSGVIPKWNDSPSTVLPILKKLMAARLRVWVYSGDTDARVPVTSTRYSINKMSLRPKEGKEGWGGWRAWYHAGQVAGWAVDYEEGLTLATVRGAGHQVPAFAPAQSLSLLTHFLAGKPLPSSLSAR